MLRQVLNFALTAFVTGLFTAMAATLYSLGVSQVVTDESASQRAQMVYLLQEIAKKLDDGPLPSGIGTRSIDLNNLEPIKPEELTLNYEELLYYKREFLVGAKLYKTSISLSGWSESGLQAENVDRIDWTFDGEAVGTTLGAQPLFLSKIKKPIFTSKKSFDVIAKVWLNKDIAENEEIDNPLPLKTQIQW